MESIPQPENFPQKNLPPWKRGENKAIEVIERKQNIERIIREQLSQIEASLSAKNESVEDLTQEEYFNLFGKVQHLIDSSKKLGDDGLLARLSAQADILEKIKIKRHEKHFEGIEKWKTFKHSKNK